MAMSELKQKLLLNELAKAELVNAAYEAQNDVIRIQTDNEERSILINDDNEVRFLQVNRETALYTVKPLVDKISEVISEWENANAVPFENISHYRVLAEYNNVIMAARDDSEYGRGLYFVTWQYNYDRTGLEHGHYTEDYAACKEDFAVRSGLIPEVKIFTPEQAAEIKTVIENLFENDYDLYLSNEKTEMLNSIIEQINDAYHFEKEKPDGKEQGFEIQEENEKVTSAINGEIYPGDWVIATLNSDYRSLIGSVTSIGADDVHVDFSAFQYPPWRKSEIEELFENISGKYEELEELPLKDITITSKMLIRITELGYDEIERMGNYRENCEAFCNSFISPSQHHGAKFEELVNRVDKNLADYHEILDGFGQGELIEMAGRIDVMNEAHHYLTVCYDFDAEELDFYLQFENPLEIVADELTNHRNYSDDLEYSMESINDRRDLILTEYPLIKETDTTVADKADKQPEVEKPLTKAAENNKPKKTLEEKMQAAKEKVKAQDGQNNDKKSRKRNERD